MALGFGLRPPGHTAQPGERRPLFPSEIRKKTLGTGRISGPPGFASLSGGAEARTHVGGDRSPRRGPPRTPRPLPAHPALRGPARSPSPSPEPGRGREISWGAKENPGRGQPRPGGISVRWACASVGGEDRELSPGSVVFVPARTEHRFHTIREALSLLVMFAPAEGSLRTSPSRRRPRKALPRGKTVKP